MKKQTEIEEELDDRHNQQGAQHNRQANALNGHKASGAGMAEKGGSPEGQHSMDEADRAERGAARSVLKADSSPDFNGHVSSNQRHCQIIICRLKETLDSAAEHDGSCSVHKPGTWICLLGLC